MVRVIALKAVATTVKTCVSYDGLGSFTIETDRVTQTEVIRTGLTLVFT